MTIKQLTSNAGAIILLCCISLFGGVASADMIEKGKKVAFDRKKGNCLACHAQGIVLQGRTAPKIWVSFSASR